MDFEFKKTSTIGQAFAQFAKTKTEKRQPAYYVGGTEILTLQRVQQLNIDVAIDIKDIPACLVHQLTEDYLVYGSCLTLTEIEEHNHFPLLTDVCKEIADRTARNKITVGGNICGAIFYREAVLPFLLTDSILVLAGKNGLRTEYIHDVFHQQLQLPDGELFVQAFIEKRYITCAYIAIKVRQQWETGYPLITIAALEIDGEMRMAFSGLCPYPFRSLILENIINNRVLSRQERINQIVNQLPGPILNDVEGSDEYRIFVLTDLLEKVIARLEGD
ncbi:FAD binding domain-containing protein [Niallia sp. FSL W8-0954]|uniref:FAD binding domain-containing protein n=1 Tax=Niallia sp. FSL W8-0954 TaxID=2975338 RepID=UPI0030FA1F53